MDTGIITGFIAIVLFIIIALFIVTIVRRFIICSGIMIATTGFTTEESGGINNYNFWIHKQWGGGSTVFEYFNYVELRGGSNYLTDAGREAKRLGHEQYHKRKIIIIDTNFKKLKLDAENAERVYKTYTITRVFAWVGAISGAYSANSNGVALCGVLYLT